MNARSTNGLTWTKQGVVIPLGGPGALDENALIGPDVIQLDDGTFRMFYTSGDAAGNHHILSAVGASPVGGIAELSEVAGEALETPESTSGIQLGLWLIIGAGVLVVTGATGVAALYRRGR